MDVSECVDPRKLASRMITPRRLPPRAVPIPEGATPFSVTHDGGLIAGWRWGHGEPVLLVHGWEATHVDMLAFVEPLLARGLGVIAVDLPAHGASEGVSATIPQMAKAVTAVGQTCGRLHGVIGHSVGGPVLTVALAGGLDAGRVVLIASPANYGRQMRAAAMASGVVDARDLAHLADELIRLGTELPIMDLPSFAERLTQPALLFHSRDDRVVAIGEAREIARYWRGSRLIELDGLGHGRILGDAGVISRAVDFLAADFLTVPS
ncbi:alpha/beta fold hydrolase [Labrys sp. LIt4]|uniref:alpha/beta fold hydrolase n=1 Tax=Labrys sp. LIt4 TaxID=2821355 RepID=UPI001ADEF250|nr:alpha/beta fold hydrolase [Labrys sp. LIt4]MBP0578219.1 alpha/beta fold hydrolase [Labrys sp. LIt4]